MGITYQQQEENHSNIIKRMQAYFAKNVEVLYLIRQMDSSGVIYARMTYVSNVEKFKR
jgi:hypothetical protein